MPKTEAEILQECKKFFKDHPGVAESAECITTLNELYLPLIEDEAHRNELSGIFNTLFGLCSDNKLCGLIHELGETPESKIDLPYSLEIGDAANGVSPADLHDCLCNLCKYLIDKEYAKKSSGPTSPKPTEVLYYRTKLICEKIELFMNFYFMNMDLITDNYLKSLYKNATEGTSLPRPKWRLKEQVLSCRLPKTISFRKISVSAVKLYCFPTEKILTGDITVTQVNQKVLAFVTALKYIYKSKGNFNQFSRTRKILYFLAIILGSKCEGEECTSNLWAKIYDIGWSCVKILGSKVSQKQDRHVLTGIPNLASSCYLNASLQQLYKDKSFRHMILSPSLNLPNIDLDGNIKGQLDAINCQNVLPPIPANQGQAGSPDLFAINDGDVRILVVVREIFSAMRDQRTEDLNTRGALRVFMQTLGYTGEQLEADNAMNNIHDSCIKVLQLLEGGAVSALTGGNRGGLIAASGYVLGGIKDTIPQKIASDILDGLFNPDQIEFLNLSPTQEILDEFDIKLNRVKESSPIFAALNEKFRSDNSAYARLFGNRPPQEIVSSPLRTNISHRGSLYVLFNAAGTNKSIKGEISEVRVGGVRFLLKSFIINTRALEKEESAETQISSVESGHYICFVCKKGKWYEMNDETIGEPKEFNEEYFSEFFDEVAGGKCAFPLIAATFASIEEAARKGGAAFYYKAK